MLTDEGLFVTTGAVCSLMWRGFMSWYGRLSPGRAITEVMLEAPYDINAFLEPGWTKVSDEAFPTFTTSRPRTSPGRKPAGIKQCTEIELKDWAEDWHRSPPYQYQTKFRVQDKRKNTRLLNCDEREVMMGFPKGYSTACYPKGEQKTQAWHDERGTSLSWHGFLVSCQKC